MPQSDQSVTVATFGDLLKHGFKLHGHCRGCGINKDVDLTQPAPERSFVNQRFKCWACGSLDISAVSAPWLKPAKYVGIDMHEKGPRIAPRPD